MRELPLKAVWLSENQNQPLVQFHEETIMFQGQERKVMLCYMLPQKKKTQDQILRRSFIESDEGINLLRRSQRTSVHFLSDPMVKVILIIKEALYRPICQ